MQAVSLRLVFARTNWAVQEKGFRSFEAPLFTVAELVCTSTHILAVVLSYCFLKRTMDNSMVFHKVMQSEDLEQTNR